MRRRLGLWWRRSLRITTLVTLAVTVALYSATPFGAYAVEMAGDELDARIDRLMTRNFDQIWLDQSLTDALTEEPVNWALVESIEAAAMGASLTPAPSVAQTLTETRARDQGWIGQGANCWACAIGSDQCRMSDGLMCAVGVELTPIGDAKVLIQEGYNYATDLPVDQVGVALSAAGLGATLAILASAGSTAAVKGGVAVLKVARRTGQLTRGLQRSLSRMGRNVIRWDRLPSKIDDFTPTGFRRAINGPVLTQIATLSTDLNRTRKAMPSGHAFQMLTYVDDAADARRIAKTSEIAGPRTLALFRHVGKSRIFRAMVKFSNLAWAVIGFLLALGVQTLLLSVELLQRPLARLVFGRPGTG